MSDATASTTESTPTRPDPTESELAELTTRAGDIVKNSVFPTFEQILPLAGTILRYAARGEYVHGSAGLRTAVEDFTNWLLSRH